MEELIRLLQDGHARTIPMLAAEMHTSIGDVSRRIEYLEHMGKVRKVFGEHTKCNGCSGCATGGDGKACKSCLPDGGFQNMGQMWEVVK